MSSSIFKDLLAEQAEYERYQREMEAMEYKRANTPKIIYQSEWHPAFDSESREYIGQRRDGMYYYALEISPQEDEQELSWHGPYETRAEAKEQLKLACNCWDERVLKREEAWEAEQIAQLEQEQGIEI
jgi:hypothetical protein